LAKKRLLILGPSFRRKKDEGLLPAFKRFDGLFFRVARKYLRSVRDIDILIMKDDLTLVGEKTILAYDPPKGNKWSTQSLPKRVLDEGRKQNQGFLDQKVRSGKYGEVFSNLPAKHCT